MTILSPPEWSWNRMRGAMSRVGGARAEEYWPQAQPLTQVPELRRIGVSDLGAVLRKGIEDFGASRTDVIFLVLIYPVIGLVLGRIAFGYRLWPLVFPLASGFALVGPLAAIGLYEMSRRREQGAEVGWLDAFGVLRSPSIGAIAYLGVVLLAIYVCWLLVAQAIYDLTLGPEPPASLGAFLEDVFATGEGWTMIGLGLGAGFLFAVLAFALGVLSFPLLLDRPATLDVAVRTSVRAVLVNPVPMAAWGLIVSGLLVLGSIPAFLGLIVVLPVLGHATWHLYRRIVPR